MSHAALVRHLAVAVLMFVSIPCVAGQEKKTDTKSLYEPTKIWQIHLTLSADEFKAMQPKGTFRFGPAPKPPEKKPEKDSEKPAREIHRNTFGMDLPWAVGSITIGDETFDKVAIRYKGNGTIADAGRTIRKSFKIDLDRHGGEGTFLASKGINLHCGVADPTRTRETIGYSLYRAAGVPAPRTTLAEVRLTVPGKYDRELLGVYTVVEPADKNFLRAHFGDASGLLMKPEGGQAVDVRNLSYRSDEWSKYEQAYAPKRPATEAEGKRMVAFFRLIHKSTDDDFQKEIGNYLEIDTYLRFLAMTSLEANMDSFFALGHNFYLYLHPKTGRLHFFPWDLDRSFANLPFLGNPAQQMDLSLMRPYAGPHRLTERLLAIPDVNEKYRGVLKEILARAFAPERVFKEIDTMDAAVKDLIAAEAKSGAARKEPPQFGGLFAPPRPPALKLFVEKRTASATAQLEGKSMGFVPTAFGFGVQPKVGDMIAPPLMAEFDTDKDGKLSRREWLVLVQKVGAAADKETQGWFDEKALAAGLATMLPKPKDPPKDAPKPPPFAGPMKDFNPALFLAGNIAKRADADKNGKVTQDELTAVAEKLFDDFDRGKTGALAQPSFRDLLTELFPAPGFGPPPRPMPEEKKGP